ncbi:MULTISPECIES: SPFH domain-containing protein [Corynebacterium]|uniref:Peptidase n=1 Tax=Corynebacterium flavescens TaxID=28028 RepID=A0A1L7CNQ1_CORFL|nr:MULTISPECIES: SPFH domain-containing protein [Corynebacterium]APT87476.1 peptidase [Corynebacterium flavescens]KAA8720290.1 SPFH domain-containing protein [Corynebacterium flavescens]MDN6100446.1 SPFH domain-containing protein [Corynebacterium flavescens]MDN6198510.1 SPFH domain-containing protein [Corynebacterium flavescens]MDN6227311.1 SPFH domain-containing protein [Corynebacterium flavescens]
MLTLIVAVVVIIVLVLNAFDAFFIVRTREAAIVERLGKFVSVAHAGLHFKVPWVDRVRAKISLQVRQLDVMVETKTKDNVFVQIPVAVQYQVVEGREREAYYMLSNHEQQIVAYVQDNVRSSVANMDLDDSFSSKDTIAQNVAMSLRDNMAAYGWHFVNTLVTDIRPDSRVRESMNSINAAQREREAAIAQAEAEKIRVVKEAEGAAEARKLQGRGVADQRKEIVEGIAAQYEMLRAAGVEESPEALMLVSQYLDAMVDVSHNGNTSVLYMPSNPAGMGELFGGMRDVLMANHVLGTAADSGPQVSKADAAKRKRELAEKARRRRQDSQAEDYSAQQSLGEGANPVGGAAPYVSDSIEQPKGAREYFQQLRQQLEQERNNKN